MFSIPINFEFAIYNIVLFEENNIINHATLNRIRNDNMDILPIDFIIKENLPSLYILDFGFFCRPIIILPSTNYIKFDYYRQISHVVLYHKTLKQLFFILYFLLLIIGMHPILAAVLYLPLQSYLYKKLENDSDNYCFKKCTINDLNEAIDWINLNERVIFDKKERIKNIIFEISKREAQIV
jgi:hypothetical protein